MAKTYGYGSSRPSAATPARPGNSGGGTAGSRVVGIPEWDRVVLDEVDDVDWSGGVYSCSREVRQVVWQGESMAQLELGESPHWGRRSAAVGRREDQYGRGEQR